MGTVAIILNDVIIATNITDSEGKIAVGSRISQEAYEKVMVEGKTWFTRDFVVADRYISGYEPLKDINGNIMGIIYTGYLEDSVKEENKIILYSFLAIIFFATIFAMIIYVHFKSQRGK